MVNATVLLVVVSMRIVLEPTLGVTINPPAEMFAFPLIVTVVAEGVLNVTKPTPPDAVILDATSRLELTNSGWLFQAPGNTAETVER